MIVIYSDLHIGLHGNKIDENGINIRLLDVLNAQKQIFQYVLDNENVTQLWFLGDLFDPKGKIPVQALSLAGVHFAEFLEQLGDRPLKFRYMVGNHDLYIKTEREHSLNFLRTSRIDIIDKPCYVRDEILKIIYLWIPYTATRERWISQVQNLQTEIGDTTEYKTVMIMHQTIKRSTVGPDNYELGDEGVSPADLFGYNQVFSGHIHKPQAMNDGQIVYIGSPLQLNWGEHTETEKGIILFDPETLDYQRGSLETPQYHVVESDRPEHAEHVVNHLLEQTIRPWMIRIDTESYAVAEKYREMGTKWAGVLLRHTLSDSEIIQATVQDQSIETAHFSADNLTTNQDLITGYLSLRGNKYQAAELHNLGVEILNSAEEML